MPSRRSRAAATGLAATGAGRHRAGRHRAGRDRGRLTGLAAPLDATAWATCTSLAGGLASVGAALDERTGLASVGQCAQALQELADKLAGVDPATRKKHTLDRTLSCTISDLDVRFSGAARRRGHRGPHPVRRRRRPAGPDQADRRQRRPARPRRRQPRRRPGLGDRAAEDRRQHAGTCCGCGRSSLVLHDGQRRCLGARVGRLPCQGAGPPSACRRARSR